MPGTEAEHERREARARVESGADVELCERAVDVVSVQASGLVEQRGQAERDDRAEQCRVLNPCIFLCNLRKSAH